jgi:hypothetical protein
MATCARCRGSLRTGRSRGIPEASRGQPRVGATCSDWCSTPCRLDRRKFTVSDVLHPHGGPPRHPSTRRHRAGGAHDPCKIIFMASGDAGRVPINCLTAVSWFGRAVRVRWMRGVAGRVLGERATGSPSAGRRTGLSQRRRCAWPARRNGRSPCRIGRAAQRRQPWCPTCARRSRESRPRFGRRRCGVADARERGR